MIGILEEAQLASITITYFRILGYATIHGPTIATQAEAPERQDCAQVVLTRRQHDTLLPKLLSREIELPEAQANAEEMSDTMVEAAQQTFKEQRS